MSSITIKVIDREGTIRELEAPTDMNLYLMEFLKMNGFAIKGTCGGICECSDCHIYINSDHELREVDIIEEMMLDELETKNDNSRLSCQLKIVESMNGLEIEIVD